MTIKAFIIDYCQRHIHPVNALLHIIGVPIVFYGVYDLFEKKPLEGLAFIALGYFFQYIGHRAQGNEVGEVTLIKKCLQLISTIFKHNKEIQSL